MKFGVSFCNATVIRGWRSLAADLSFQCTKEGRCLTYNSSRETVKHLKLCKQKKGKKVANVFLTKDRKNDRLFGVCEKFFLSYILTARGGLLLRIWVKLLPVSSGTRV